MNYYFTTIEQSKKLLSLGIDPSTADMVYINGKYCDFAPEKPKIQPLCVFSDQDAVRSADMNLVAWSFAALIYLLPPNISMHGRYWRLVLYKWFDDEEEQVHYEISYVDGDENILRDGYQDDTDVIAAGYRMVLWLADNKLI